MSRRLHVLRVIDRLNVGGPVKHVTGLGGLTARGIDATLVTGRVAPGEADMTWYARAAGIEPVIVPTMSRALRPADVAVAWRLWRLMVRLRPDVVETHKAKAGAVGRAAALFYRWATPGTLVGRPRPVRVVHTFHGHTFAGYYGPLASRAVVLLERFLAHVATDRVVVLSERQRDDVVTRYRVAPAARTVVVPLGVEPLPPQTPGVLRAAVGAVPDELVIGSVGRLCEVKNHALLLEATAILLRDGVRARLAVVGDGHLRCALEAQAAALGIADRVAFLGVRADAAALYGDMDLVASTSHNEGTPFALLEGLAARRPAVATAVGGVPDVLGAPEGTAAPGVARWAHGLTTASGDAAAFARALRWLAERPAERAGMGARGAAWVREERSLARLLDDTAALYAALGRGSAEGDHAGTHHGRRWLHRLASRRALSRPRRRGVPARRPLDRFDRQHPEREGAPGVHVPRR